MPSHTDAPRDYALTCPSGHGLAVHADTGMGGAWLYLPGHDHYLLVVSQSFAQGDPLVYAGYRDGVCKADKLAISVDKGNAVTIQIVLPGDEWESNRIETITLAELESMVFARRALPQ